MKTAYHTRSSGKQLSYRIEYDGKGYKIFYRERFLKLGAAPVAPNAPRWADDREQQHLKMAIQDIEELAGMAEV